MVGVDNGAPMASDAPSGAPIGLMSGAADVCLVVDVNGIPADVDPDDEALPDGCAT